MAEERYVLAQGAEAEYRLQIVNSVHGADSEAFLNRSGLRPGLRVADIGCGVGVLSCWMAGVVGSSGEVVGVDVSPAQVATAQRRAEREGLTNVRFLAASGYETGLESEAFDIVYSRFMLMHLQRPLEALTEMRRLLKPGGTLVVEDGDFMSPFCYPPSAAYDRCFEIYRDAGAQHGEHFLLGQQLYKMVRDVGFTEVQAGLVQPLFTRGDAKRLPEWTLEEGAESFITAGLTTREELDVLIAELARLAADEDYAFGMARMMQVTAKK